MEGSKISRMVHTKQNNEWNAKKTSHRVHFAKVIENCCSSGANRIHIICSIFYQSICLCIVYDLFDIPNLYVWALLTYKLSSNIFIQLVLYRHFSVLNCLPLSHSPFPSITLSCTLFGRVFTWQAPACIGMKWMRFFVSIEVMCLCVRAWIVQHVCMYMCLCTLCIAIHTFTETVAIAE